MQQITKLYTEKQAAEFLGYPKQSLQQWRMKGVGPLYRKLPTGGVRYVADDLLAFIGSPVVPGGLVTDGTDGTDKGVKDGLSHS